MGNSLFWPTAFGYLIFSLFCVITVSSNSTKNQSHWHQSHYGRISSSCSEKGINYSHLLSSYLGERDIDHIDTLHQLKRFWNSGALTHPARAQAFIQSNLVMGAGDTDITDDAPVSDKSWDFLTSECLSAPCSIYQIEGSEDWSICNIYVFTGTLESATN